MFHCEWCKKEFWRRKRPRDDARFCSQTCAARDRGSKREHRDPKVCKVYFPTCVHCAAIFCSSRCTINTCLPCRRLPKRNYSKCTICGRLSTPRPFKSAKYCSDACQAVGFKDSHKKANERTRQTERYAVWIKDYRRKQRHKRKAESRSRLAKVFIEHIDIAALIVRDHGICQICKRKVKPEAVPHPKAPTIDHIVPLASDGLHEYRNVQLAHFICNSRRQNKGSAQLRLL